MVAGGRQGRHSSNVTTLLDLPAIRERAAQISVEDYHRLGEMPVELLRGTIIRKMPKSPRHQFYTERLRKILESQISSRLTVRQEGPLTFADSEPEPDVAIVRGKPEDCLDFHPSSAELVVEIAISSLEIDQVKGLIYAEAGVKEYWIVCPERREVEVYRQPAAQGYAESLVIAPPMLLESLSVPGVRVDLASFFV